MAFAIVHDPSLSSMRHAAPEANCTVFCLRGEARREGSFATAISAHASESGSILWTLTFIRYVSCVLLSPDTTFSETSPVKSIVSLGCVR